MEGFDLTTAVGVASFASLLYQIVAKPILKSALGHTQENPSPYYGVLALLCVALFTYLSAVLGTLVNPSTEVLPLFGAGFPIAVTLYEGISQAASAVAGR